jgi:hypothetical protein
MYSIGIRSLGIETRPLFNLLQPMHPCSRYTWVQKPSYSGSQSPQGTVNSAKMPVRTKNQATKRGV